MRLGFVLGVGLLCLACVGVVAANEPPLASAGLDQESRVNATVYLDAGGSLDPDGSIERYRWTVETPDGNTTTPDCPTCAQTWFVPRQTGRYNLTVEVTDGNGAHRNDTLYVDVGGVASSRQPPSTPAGSGGGGPSPSLGGSSGGGGGSSSPSGRWSAVVDEGDELVLSNPRGADFVFSTPNGKVSIDTEQFSELRENDGEVTYSETSHIFLEEGVTRSDLEEATRDGSNSGNNCRSSSGYCTTQLREEGSLSDEWEGVDELQPDTTVDDSSASQTVIERSFEESSTATEAGISGALGDFFTGGLEGIEAVVGTSQNDEPSHSSRDTFSKRDDSIVDTVFDNPTSDQDNSGQDSDDNDDSGWDSDDGSNDDPVGSDVPMEL